MIAWISPALTVRSSPFKISLPSIAACKLRISSIIKLSSENSGQWAVGSYNCPLPLFPPLSIYDFDDRFDLDRDAVRQRSHSDRRPRVSAVFAEHLDKQVRASVD